MDHVTQWALDVLTTETPKMKVLAARKAAARCREIAPHSVPRGESFLPDRPARPSKPLLTTPKQVPKRNVRSARGRIALVHALAHIELNAIDLAFDMAARFARDCKNRLGTAGEAAGEVLDEFVLDWIGVGAEEAEHFELLENRLEELGSFYGAMNAHDGLWQAAIDTKDNWAARLAVVPMVLEARGLDVSPATISALQQAGDQKTAEILEKIYKDEIRHVEIGVKWFNRLCEADGVKANEAFKLLVSEYFAGQLKPPFNEEARKKAGLLPNFYRSDG